MKTILTLALCLLSIVANAANPSTKSFRGTGGIAVVSNDATGLIIIDGSGISGGGTPGGANRSVQFNNAGAFGGDTNFQYFDREWYSEFFGPTFGVGNGTGGSTNIMDPYGITVLGNDINFRTPDPTSPRWRITTAGDLLPWTTNLHDVGSWSRPVRTNWVNDVQSKLMTVITPFGSAFTNVITAASPSMAVNQMLRIGFSSGGLPLGFLGAVWPYSAVDSALTFGTRGTNVESERMRLGVDGNLSINSIYGPSTLSVAGGAAITGGLVVSEDIHKRIVYSIGDSLTYSGYHPTLETLLGTNYTVINGGVGGNETVSMLNRLYPDVINWNNGSWLIVWGGINDIVHDVALATITNNLQTIYSIAASNGLGVVAMTVTPFGSNALWTAGRQTVLQSVNAFILSSAINVNYRLNLYTNIMSAADTNAAAGRFDAGDGLHLNALGMATIGTNIFNNTTLTGVNNNTNALTVKGSQLIQGQVGGTVRPMLHVGTNLVNGFTVSSNGNIGIGMKTPLVRLEVDGSDFLTAMKVGTFEFTPFDLNNAFIAENIYYNGGFKYRANGVGTLMYFSGTGWEIRTAPSGSAGATASPSTRIAASLSGDVGLSGNLTMTAGAVSNANLIVKVTGNVGIGTSVPSSSLDVTGQVRAASAILTNGITFTEGAGGNAMVLGGWANGIGFSNAVTENLSLYTADIGSGNAWYVGGSLFATNYTVFGTTNQITFGASNPPPVSAVAPTKWISVKIQGDAGLYKLPLYQ